MCTSLCGVVLISGVCSGCATGYGLPIPAKEMAIYRLESRIRLLEHYDKDKTKSECDAMRQQIAGLKKAIEEDKRKK